MVLATGNRLVMEPSLEEALVRLFGPEAGLGTAGAARPARSRATRRHPRCPRAAGAATSAAAREARAAYQRALEALRGGDFGRFGEELRNLDARLADLERTAEIPAPVND